MDLQLKGKKAFVSGSTAGIGFAIAKKLAEEGATVTLNGRTQQRVDDALAAIAREVPHAHLEGIAADFSKPAAISALAPQLANTDILVNNVGIFTSQTFDETPDEDWYRLFEVNVMSGVRLSRLCLPHMLRQNWGRILFISSECALLVPDNLIAYSTTKAALHALSRGLAHTVKGTAVTVNTLMPGSTLSEGATRFLQETAERSGISAREAADQFFREVRTSSLIQRFIDPEEIAP
jgi:NAD(P)-dependent dehydrogenase (short-subunit alcohol dehydrogenase family)